MRLAFSIALRYLFSKKSHNAVNVISMVSVAGVAVATAALIVVLSVFNGFADLAQRQLSRIDPPLAVVPSSGKVIANADSVAAAISASLPGCEALPVMKEQALAVAGNHRMPVMMLGVPERFIDKSSLGSVTIDGEAIVEHEPWTRVMSSVGVALGLNVRPGDYRFIELYVPRRVGRISTSTPAGAFRSDSVVMAGVYQVEQESYDTDMLIVPLESTRDLLDYSTEASAVYLYPSPSTDVENAKKVAAAIAGEDCIVKDRIEQQSDTFKMISVEKWITFLLLTFILVIASFNIISTMAMMIIEKEPNMAILNAMGATRSMTNMVFVIEGWLITVAGGAAGIVAGVALSLAQQYGGFIKLSTSNPSALAIDSYPVVLAPGDIAVVAALVIGVGLLTALCSLRTKV